MCSNTNEVESQGKYIHEQIIDDEWNSLYLLEVIWFMYMQNVAIRICGKMNIFFSNLQVETHLKPPTLKHIGIALYYT
jgi:hypothetical protein